MNGHGKSDGPVVPAKRPNNAGRDPVAEAVEGSGRPRGVRTGRHVPHTAADKTCHSGWIAYAKQHVGTAGCSSPRCCTMLMSTVYGRHQPEGCGRGGRGHLARLRHGS